MEFSITAVAVKQLDAVLSRILIMNVYKMRPSRAGIKILTNLKAGCPARYEGRPISIRYI